MSKVLETVVKRGRARVVNPLRQRWLGWQHAGNPQARVLANSVPKAGTHLLLRCLNLFPQRVNYHDGIFVLGLGMGRGLQRRMPAIERMPGGAHASAHIPFAPWAADYLREQDVKTLLMIRDPRDIVVSQARWEMNNRTLPHYEYMKNLPDDETRIRIMIEGDPSYPWPTIQTRLIRYTPWLTHGSLLVRFEDLVGARGGGSEVAQLAQIGRIADHLNVTLSAEQTRTIADQLFDPTSRTFNKGTIGRWRNHFQPHHVDAMKVVAGDLLVELGYEQDDDWGAADGS